MKMKKIVFTGIILVLVMLFAVTCDTPAVEEVEYTDVVYSPDGSEVTLYLDGVGVPVTPAQRAINRELATMAYDYFEVIFIGGDSTDATQIARTNWELGQPAGIANVPRGAGTVGINYAYDATKVTGTARINIACMFVGKKSDRTLLGIGFIKEATHRDPPTGVNAGAPGTTVNSSTTSVKFFIAAIQTGLLAGTTETIDDNSAATTIVPGVRFDSFNYAAGGYAGYVARTADNSTRSQINGSPLSYPRYALPQVNGAVVNATYEFAHVDINGTTTGGTNEYFAFAKVINTDATTSFFKDRPLVQKRVPRFMSGGRYMEPKEGWTTTTSVNFFVVGSSGNYTTPTGGTGAGAINGLAFNPLVGLQFSIRGSGVFSFYLQIPVYMLIDTTATFESSSVAPIKWYIRTGVGSELYSLDDGAANGGCVFMSVGSSGGNWMDIEWEWIN